MIYLRIATVYLFSLFLSSFPGEVDAHDGKVEDNGGKTSIFAENQLSFMLLIAIVIFLFIYRQKKNQ